MRHRKAGHKLGRSKSARRALLVGLALALVEHERVRTTLAKAKMLRPYLERLITLGKRNTLHARRLICSRLGGGRYAEGMSAKVVSVLAPRCASRPGGYLRIVKAGFRPGDNAPVAVIMFVDEAGA